MNPSSFVRRALVLRRRLGEGEPLQLRRLDTAEQRRLVERQLLAELAHVPGFEFGREAVSGRSEQRGKREKARAARAAREGERRRERREERP